MAGQLIYKAANFREVLVAKPKVQSAAAKRKTRKDELKEPDEVTTALQTFSEHLNKHFKRYVIGLAALIALILGVDAMVQQSRAQDVKRTEAFMESTQALNSSVQDFAKDESLLPPTGTAGKEIKAKYASDKERWAAAAEKSKNVAEELPADLKKLATLSQGRAAMGLKQWDDANKLLSAFASENSDSNLLPIVLENQAVAAEAVGDAAKAAEIYAELAKSSDLYYIVRAQMALGDLHNPAFGKKGSSSKDPAKARSHYDEALKALTPKEGQQLGESLSSLRGEIRRRQALITQ